MPNSLAREKSPYLLQHADNPVSWLPWGEDAFAKARTEQKPVFLSIGYSTCHWCHVMAHESFENAEIAALLNEHFVSIKVDREERPDVDRVYMHYVQALTGHGGWPLSAWLTPELKPFYGGTYFAPDDRHGRPGLPNVLRAIASGWANEREKLVAEAERVIASLKQHYERPPVEKGEADLTEAGGDAFEKCFQHFYESFDATDGGFGGAPKFPRASNLSFLFRAAAIQGLESEPGREAVRMAAHTLQKMTEGGLHDQVGGGFHRYSVDEAWFVPHFEKMLYDQAQIAVNLLEAYQADGREIFAWVAKGVLGYVLRDLEHAGGGFYSAEDADSEPSGNEAAPAGHGAHRKVEGAFYVWTKAEIDAALGGNAGLVCAHFGVLGGGNVPEAQDPQREFHGKNIVKQRQPLGATAKLLGIEIEEASNRLVAALETLRDVRARRLRPHLDDKILTAWNGLMISALAKAAAVPAESLGGERKIYLEAASRTAEFLKRELYDEKRGVLYRVFRDGRGDNEGFAEDYAYLVQGLLDLYEAGFDVRWLQWAERLQTTMDRLFWDEERGGYFNSAGGDPNIVLRLKEDYDGAEPAASSVAAMNLLRLSQVAADPGPMRTRAIQTLEAFREQWSRLPQALPQMLCALELALEPPRHAVIAGDPAAADFRALASVLNERLGPRRTLLAADAGDGQRWLAGRLPWMADMTSRDGRATVYLCEHFTCQAPVSDAEALRTLLK